MSDASSAWKETFSDLFKLAVEKYRKGHQKAQGLVDTQGVEFLQSIGHTEQEFFDFVEDFAKGGSPTLETAIEIASVRRDYFLHEQKGKLSTHQIAMEKLPPKDAEIEGIGWLPRLIPKAEAKLRGEMPPDLMFCCGGDRKFFAAHHIEPADFLRKVWKMKGDKSEIVSWVKTKSKS